MKPRHWLAFILLGTIWGSSFLWIKIAVQEAGPFTLVAFRLLFGILGLSVVVLVARPAFPSQRRLWLLLTIFGFTNNAIPYLLISWGEKTVDSAVAAILNSSTPLFTMIVANFFLHDDRLTLKRLAGLLTGFVGIVILMSRDLDPGYHGSLLGQGAILVASLCYGVSSVFARRTTRGLSPVIQALIPLLGADALLWAVTPLAESPFTFPVLPLTWVAMAWLGLLGTCVAFLLYFYLLHSIGPTRTTLVTYVFPLVGVILGVAFLNERMDWHLLMGGCLVVGSIITVTGLK